MLLLRLANADDAPVILRLVRALAEYEREPDAVQLTEALLRAQMSSTRPPFECLLADRNGQTVGFALYFTSYSTWLGKPGLWLEDLFVLPEARRNGVGTALLQRLAEITQERDYGRLEWSVLDWNQPAIDFYTSLGAQIMGQWRICRVTGAALGSLAAARR